MCDIFRPAASSDSLFWHAVWVSAGHHSELISYNSIQDVETGPVAKLACSRMKPGKMDVSESYSSDILLNGPDVLIDLLFSAPI